MILYEQLWFLFHLVDKELAQKLTTMIDIKLESALQPNAFSSMIYQIQYDFQLSFSCKLLSYDVSKCCCYLFKNPNVYTFFYSLKIIPYMVYILWYQNSSIFPLNTQTSNCTDIFVYKLFLHKSARKVVGSMGKGKGVGGRGYGFPLRKLFI